MYLRIAFTKVVGFGEQERKAQDGKLKQVICDNGKHVYSLFNFIFNSKIQSTKTSKIFGLYRLELAGLGWLRSNFTEINQFKIIWRILYN